MLLIPILTLLFFAAYYYLIKPLKYWKQKKIQYETPLPIFGNMLRVALNKCSIAEVLQQIYNKYPNRRYIGMYNFTTPTLMVTNPELLKQIMVKEFETFPEHRQFIPSNVDPLWSKNLLAMEGGEEWHALRATLSPSFTSSKMRAMFVLMKECTTKFCNYYNSKEGIVELEFKDTFARFSNDVIANCAFGVTCDSQADPNNEMYRLAKELMDFSGIRRFALIINVISPSLGKIIRLPFFSSRLRTFFTTLVSDTLRLREEKNIIRPDMLHLLMESRKGRLKYDEDTYSIPQAGFAAVEESQFGKVQTKSKIEITDELITAQALIFYFGGLDTVSTMLGHITHELALHQDIQQRLREEIDCAVKSTHGELTYENLMNMKYLDMIVSESLRKWPPFIMNDRRSVRPYVIEATEEDEVSLYLEKQSIILIPTFCIHRDPIYFPNPDKFDPERFSEKNRHNIHPFTYLPFGMGPRSCIASRFALLEVKLLITELVKTFEIVTTSKTQIPLVLNKNDLSSLPDKGFWLGIRRRSLK